MDLDLLQKFTEDRKFYELDEAIIDSLETMHVKQAMYILLCLEKMIPYLEIKNNRSQLVASVIPVDDPIYFAVRYIYEKDTTPYFFDLQPITVDEYLDLYNLKKTINYDA
jgi:hypothetical protein